MKNFPRPYHGLPLGGLEMHEARRTPLERRRLVWFYCGFCAALTLAGFVAGLLP